MVKCHGFISFFVLLFWSGVFLGNFSVLGYLTLAGLFFGMILGTTLILKRFILNFIRDFSKRPSSPESLALVLASFALSFVAMLVTPFLLVWQLVIEPLIDKYSSSIEEEYKIAEALKNNGQGSINVY